MKKVIYIDTEGTGLDAKVGKGGKPLNKTSCIVNLGGIIEINGKGVKKFNYYAQPVNWDCVTEEALEINGLTMEQLKSFPKPQVMYKKFIKLMGQYIDKWDKQDKFFFGGWNTAYDMDMLNNFFQKMGDSYLGSWISMGAQLDGLKLFCYLNYKGRIEPPKNHSLIEACKTLGVSLENAHTAADDIMATYKCIKKMDKMFNQGMLDVL